MADLNPISARRRLFALSNESRTKTLLVAFLTAAICSLLVSTATVILRPIQTANRAAERQLRLEALVSAIPGMQDLLTASAGAELSTVIIDLHTARAAQDVTPETLETALQDSRNWTALPPEADVAGIGSRPNLVQAYILRAEDRVALVILPITGAGYVGPIDAMIALHGDMETIAGFTVTAQSETPGLGARIEEPAWQANFAGTRFVDPAGEMKFQLSHGTATTDYEVDGITGATRTSGAVTRMVRFWLGPDGYGPLLAAIKRGEF